MRVFPLRLSFLLVLALGAASAPAATFTYAAPPKALVKAYGKTAFQFGYLTVPERHANPLGPQIHLSVVILRAKQPSAGSRPVIHLTGGPGGVATDSAAYFAVFPALQERHDVVLVDQRGTGYSQPFLGFSDRDTIAEARARFARKGIDLTAYNTTENAADIADLRPALGYAEVILFGNSYGSFLAQEVMRSHPAGIAAVVLDGVLPAADTFIPPFNRNTLHGVRELIGDVRRTGPARRAFPSFGRTYFDLLRRLRTRPIFLDNGFKVTLDAFQGGIIGLLQSPERIRYIPLLVRSIASRSHGDFVQRFLSFQEGPHDFALGMYLSTLGADWNQPGWLALTKETDSRLRPQIFRRTNTPGSVEVVLATRKWNVPYAPQATRTPLASSIPTLLFAGEMEAQTPFRGAEIVAAGLPNSFTLFFPRSGHITGFTPGPALQALVQFADAPDRRPVYSLAGLKRPNFYATTVPATGRDRLAPPEPGFRFVR